MEPRPSTPLPMQSSGKPAMPPSKHKVAFFVALGVLVLEVIVVLGYFSWQTLAPEKLKNAAVTAPSTSTASSDTAADMKTATKDATDTKADAEPTNTANDPVLWHAPKEISSLHVLKNEEGYLSDDLAQYYEVGTFTDGMYKDGTIVLVSGPMGGPAVSVALHRFAVKDGKYTLLGKYSDEPTKDIQGTIYWDTLNPSTFTLDETYTIPSLEFPETITAPNGAKLEREKWANSLFALGNIHKVFTDKTVGDVYTTAKGYENGNGGVFTDNGFYIKAPDGSTAIYGLTIPFLGNEVSSVPNITWNDGTKTPETYYNYRVGGGCGSSNFADVIDPRNGDELKITGKASNGDPIYEIADPKSGASRTREFYNEYKEGIDTGVLGTTRDKLTFEQFVVRHPLFFWKDPFNRTIMFRDNTYMGDGCGKPVIYLYPQKPTDVSVKVEPQGGMTKSDPAYKGGWNVHAETNGALTQLGTGKTYPYLFWEGKGGLYEQPKRGFVIAQKDVHTFLLEKLAKLGLNQNESKDFMEFWEPRMQGSPYYFVTFLGTRDMDRLAPLTIEPKPDTVIRILMDFSPLQKPISVEGFTIQTPERKGFTVIEWGGVLR